MVRVTAHCNLSGASCNCSIQDTIETWGNSSNGCRIVEPRLQPYTNGTLSIKCQKECSSGFGVAVVTTAYGSGTIHTTACGLYPTMSLKFKEEINPLVFGKNANPVSVQATASQSFVRNLKIQNHEPLVSLLSKDITTDILSFTPEIL